MATIKTGNRRLLKLAAFLEKLPRKRFDYRVWVGKDWKGAPDLSCGTTACALGWATTMPEFRRLGLRLRPLKPLEYYAMGGTVVDIKNSLSGDPAARRIFALSDDDAYNLFISQSDREAVHATPKYVAKKIRKFVADRERELKRK